MPVKNDGTNNNVKHPTAWGLFLTLLAIVFIVDIFTNKITDLFSLPPFPESLLDGFLVIFLAYPALHFFIFRPLIMEISEKKRGEGLLRQAKEKAELIYRVTPSAIFTLDKAMRITSWNDKAAEITGYSFEELKDKPCSIFAELPCSDNCDAHNDSYDKPIAGKECYIKTKDGRVLTILKNTDHFHDMAGKVIGFIESFEDITTRKRLEDELRESRDYFNEIINSVADPIFVKDRQHRWMLLNSAYRNFVGHRTEDLIGKTDHDLLTPKEAEISWNKDEDVFNSGKEVMSEEEFTDAKGKVHTIATKKTLYTNIQGEKFIVGIIRDITERKRVEKLKDEFIGTVSHELRTPLSITKEGISLILDKITGPINEQQARILTVSKNNIDRLSRIINSLLDISRIESGKIAVRREPFEIVSIVRQALSAFELKMKEKGLALRSILPAKEIIVRGDLDGMIQVLSNLIGNSYKFTENGSVELSLKEVDGNVEIAISDTGIGIAEDDVPKLFDKFQQFGRVNGPGEKGTGLGLAIAKGIISAHGGKIWAESSPGKGTKITFMLPKNVQTNKEG